MLRKPRNRGDRVQAFFASRLLEGQFITGIRQKDFGLNKKLALILSLNVSLEKSNTIAPFFTANSFEIGLLS